MEGKNMEFLQGDLEPVPAAEKFRWDVDWASVALVDRPMCYLVGFEPGPEETTKEYLARLLATPEAVRWPMPPFRLYRRQWWQFWLKPKPPSKTEAEARCWLS